jgi:hypothetical protein
MDPLTIALIALRSVGTLFGMQGRNDVQLGINAALDAVAAGKNVDAYLQEIADALEAGVEPDWDDLTLRINSEVDAFLDDTGDET